MLRDEVNKIFDSLSRHHVSDEKQKELDIKNKIIPTIVITLSIITYLISVFILSRWYVQNERNKKRTI